MAEPSHPRRSRVLPGLVLVGLTAAGVAGYLDLRQRSAELQTAIAEVGEGVERNRKLWHLVRFEQRSKAGLGLAALLEQIREYAPLRWDPATPFPERDTILVRLKEIVSAMTALEPQETWNRLADAFRTAAAAGEDDEVLAWITYDLVEVDATRSKPFLVDVVRGLALRVTPRTRLFAADRLSDLDRELAGATLQSVLLYESANGVNMARMPRALAEKHPNAELAIGPYPGFYNFVQRYFETEHAEREATLLMLVARQEHDLPTVQTCVKLLGEMRSQQAVKVLEKLFERPPAIRQNSIFRRHCLEALSLIRGAQACTFFQESLRAEKDKIVQAKLVDLIKQNCQQNAGK